MADVAPQIMPMDPHSFGSSYREQVTTTTPNGEGPLSSRKAKSSLDHPASPSINVNGALDVGAGEGERGSEAAIDPLSQHILKRTNTSPAIQRLRAQNTDSPNQISSSPSDANLDKKVSAELPRDSGATQKIDKKKGSSFLSRFIGANKKKGVPDTASEDGPEVDDHRPEGMDAQLFTDNFGFRPNVPQAPSYIKVRARYKKEKEFDRVFLAQELRGKGDKPIAVVDPVQQSGSAASKNPVWAVEFSKDGRFLAAGGQDRVVRVWVVISSPEDRHLHEHAERQPFASGEDAARLSTPVFQHKTLREYTGHTGTILDLSWSKNNFLLSSSMDKTVRLWHVSRDENLCVFKHSDFVPSVHFHPTDDRFFLAGSLDSKLRLWSIPDKNIAFTAKLPDMITAVAFTPDGKTCIAGTLSGLCMFYDTDGLKWQTQLHVKSTRGQNAKGSKITGIHATYWPAGSTSGEIKLLITSNDSRIRVYNFKEKTLEMKIKGHENNCSQIRATFADSSGHIICGSEDRKAYIWSTTAPEGEKGNQRPVEMFEAHRSITTCTVIAPVETRQLLSASEDPIYDLCNPPPVKLVSRAESVVSSRAPTEAGSALPIPAATDAQFRRGTETPAYLSRCAHRGGNIIVTADFTGAIKVFRQDCAFSKRIRMSETWETSSLRRAGSKLGRPSSILSRNSRRRDSVSTQPPNDRIMTWRQGISHGSFDSSSSLPRRNASPRKSWARLSLHDGRTPESPSLKPAAHGESQAHLHGNTLGDTPRTSLSIDHTTSQSPTHSPPVSPPQAPSRSSPAKLSPAKPRVVGPEPGPGVELEDTSAQPLVSQASASRSYNPLAAMPNPLALYNGQSWLFWSRRDQKAATLADETGRPGLEPRLSEVSSISRLTSEQASVGRSGDEESGEEGKGGLIGRLDRVTR